MHAIFQHPHHYQEQGQFLISNYHFLITASLEERVKRKCIQYNGKINEEEVRKNIIQRDKLQEESGFYTKYKNTIVVDVTNCKTAKESANKVFDDIKMS